MISKKGLKKIEETKHEIINMARYVQNLFSKCSLAILGRNEHHARDVLYSISILDQYAFSIENKVVGLVGTLMPTGRELRFLVMAANITRTLRMIGEKCTALANKSLLLTKHPPIGFYETLKKMINTVDKMLADAVDNLINPSLSDAQMICEQDDRVDKMLDKVEKELKIVMEESPKLVSRAIELLTIFRLLEEIGDLCTEIIESSMYVAEGKYYHCANDMLEEVSENGSI